MGSFSKTAEGKPRFCRSCHLVEHGEEPSSSSATRGKKRSETFVDVDRCSSCNPYDDGMNFPEVHARREFWYAGTRQSEDEGEEDALENQGKSGKNKVGTKSGVLSKLKGLRRFRRRGGDYSKVSQEEEEEEDCEDGEGDGEDDDDDMPPPPPLSLRRQEAFRIKVEGDAKHFVLEQEDGFIQLSTREDVPSISLREARPSSEKEEEEEEVMHIERNNNTFVLLTPPSPRWDPDLFAVVGRSPASQPSAE